MDPGGSRRVELKAFEKPAKANEKPTKANEVKPLKLAIRFEIKLEESTDEKCPEISYTDLLLKHERKRKRTNSTSLSSGVVREMIRNYAFSPIICETPFE